MGKKLNTLGASVRVEVEDSWPTPAKDGHAWRRLADKIADSVKRHVDGFARVSVNLEVEPVCEHCGAPWTEDSNTFNGGCCAKDEDAERRATEHDAMHGTRP